MKKAKNVIILLGAIMLISAIVLVVKSKSKKDISPQEMIERFEAAIGDEYKKQTQTEVIATLVYGDGTEDNNINYHILKTTYYEADPDEVTGLNTDALSVLFDPDYAVSCEEMKIQGWDAALYKTSKHSFLCWTFSPEVSYVLEYNPEAISDEEIIKMAESAKPYEGEES